MNELLTNVADNARLIAMIAVLLMILVVWGRFLSGYEHERRPLTGWCPVVKDTFEAWDVWDTGVEGFVYTHCTHCDQYGNVGVFRNPNKPATHVIDLQSETAHGTNVDGFEFKA